MSDWKKDLKAKVDEEVGHAEEHKSDDEENVNAGEDWVKNKAIPAFKEFADGAEEAGVIVELEGHGSTMTVTHESLTFELKFSAGRDYGMKHRIEYGVEVTTTPQDGSARYITEVCGSNASKAQILEYIVHKVKDAAGFSPKKR